MSATEVKEKSPEQIDAEAMTTIANLFPAKPEQGMNRSLDQVSRDVDAYVDSGVMSPEDKGLVEWLFLHGKQKGLSFDAVGKQIGYSAATVSRLFAGKYEGAVGDVVEAIRRFQHLASERAKMTSDTFVETSLWETVRAGCNQALICNAPVFISGPSQMGKTKSLLEYQRRAKSNVIYCYLPAAPSFKLFVEYVAEACGVNPSLRTDDLRRRVPGALNPQTLFIVDEAHKLALSSGKTTIICMEWLREIFDRSQCGLVVCGTEAIDNELMSHAARRAWLNQFAQRAHRLIRLPKRIPDSDLALTAATYGFPPPDAHAANILATISMSHLCACLKMTATVAKNRGEEKTWQLFAAVYDKNFGGIRK